MEKDAESPAEGLPPAESGQAASGAGKDTDAGRGADGHAARSESDDTTRRALAQIEKSLQIVIDKQEQLGQRFEQHIHQPVEVRSDATSHPSEGGTSAPEGQPASPPAEASAPTPEATKPPPAPKVARGIGPMKHRKGRG